MSDTNQRPTPITDAFFQSFPVTGSGIVIGKVRDFCHDLERQLAEVRESGQRKVTAMAHRIAQLEHDIKQVREQPAELFCLKCGENILSMSVHYCATPPAERQTPVSLDPMMERALRAEKRLSEALALAESNGKLAHNAAIGLREAREQRDALATVLTEIRAEYGGQVADPRCDCGDCEFLLRIDKALATLKP